MQIGFDFRFGAMAPVVIMGIIQKFWELIVAIFGGLILLAFSAIVSLGEVWQSLCQETRKLFVRMRFGLG